MELLFRTSFALAILILIHDSASAAGIESAPDDVNCYYKLANDPNHIPGPNDPIGDFIIKVGGAETCYVPDSLGGLEHVCNAMKAKAKALGQNVIVDKCNVSLAKPKVNKDEMIKKLEKEVLILQAKLKFCQDQHTGAGNDQQDRASNGNGIPTGGDQAVLIPSNNDDPNPWSVIKGK